MDVNEHERLSKFTLRHKLKIGTNAVLHFTLKQNNYIPQIDHQFFGDAFNLDLDISFNLAISVLFLDQWNKTHKVLPGVDINNNNVLHLPTIGTALKKEEENKCQNKPIYVSFLLGNLQNLETIYAKNNSKIRCKWN
jgi:hypothetical protein